MALLLVVASMLCLKLLALCWSNSRTVFGPEVLKRRAIGIVIGAFRTTSEEELARRARAVVTHSEGNMGMAGAQA